MALLLNVSRSNYSLCELGLRNLPSKARTRQIEMLSYMITPEAKAPQNLPKMEDEESKIKQILEKRIKENEFRLKVIIRKGATLQVKLEKCEKAVQLLRFLNLPEEIEKAVEPKAVPIIESIVISNFKETKSELILLRIDQELLQVQLESLQKALREFETS